MMKNKDPQTKDNRKSSKGKMDNKRKSKDKEVGKPKRAISGYTFF